jgi:menaquinone-specific isochorismate synthase
VTTLAHGTRLVATTRAVHPTRPLLDELGPDGFAWLRDDAGFVTSGAVARVNAAEAVELLASISHDDRVGLPGTGPVAVGGLPFRPERRVELVVPARIVGRTPDGTRWLTELHAPGVAAVVPMDPHPTERPGRFLVSALQSRAWWRTEVMSALSAIGSGSLEKVVLAREVVVEADFPFSRREVLARLVASQPDCYVYAAGALVGASPELLVARRGDVVTSLPMAGTVARAGDDASRVTALADSDKDRREHRVVVDAVVAALQTRCEDVHADAVPSLARLTDVAHLATRIVGRVREPAASALDLARLLSPTPAVAGAPRDVALELLTALEPFDRGCYGGPVGWVDARGDGEWAVALRGAELDRRRARLLAGAGIVAGSDPEAEWAETEAKLAPMLRVLVTP